MEREQWPDDLPAWDDPAFASAADWLEHAVDERGLDPRLAAEHLAKTCDALARSNDEMAEDARNWEEWRDGWKKIDNEERAAREKAEVALLQERWR